MSEHGTATAAGRMKRTSLECGREEEEEKEGEMMRVGKQEGDGSPPHSKVRILYVLRSRPIGDPGGEVQTGTWLCCSSYPDQNR